MKIKIISILVLLLLSSCKQSLKQKENVKNNNTERVEIHKEQKQSVVDTEINSKKKLNLDFMQGIWEGETDENQTKSYRIINKNKVIDLMCVEGLCDGSEDNTIIEIGKIGFIDEKKEKLNIVDLKKQGKYMILVDHISGGNLIEKYRTDKNYSYKSGNSFYKTSLTSQYMFDDETPKQTTFVKINTLNSDAYNALKLISNRKKRDYIKEFNLEKNSQRVRIVVDKSNFYNDAELKDKRKAFLVKGDIAYLEDKGKGYVKVYYDGKRITKGYLKLSEIQIIE